MLCKDEDTRAKQSICRSMKNYKKGVDEMKCNFNVEDLIKYTENLLSDEDKERVLEHLNSCEKCKETMAC